MRLAFAALLTCVGCSAALDLERARALFSAPEQEQAPAIGTTIVELPAPRELHAVSGELRMVPLRWDPVLTGDVAGYVLERALTAEGPFERVATSPGRFSTAWVDHGGDAAAKPGGRRSAGLGDGNRYHYRVRTFRSDGSIGALVSPVADASTAQRPASPERLRAYSQLPRYVALGWSASDDPGVAGYVLYRSPSATGEYLEIVRLSGRFSTTWEDRGLGALRVFYYRVAALNAAGGEGEPSEAVRAVTKPEPLPPVGLAIAEQRLGRNLLRWEANAENDITGYRLVRLHDEGTRTSLVAQVPASTMQAEDVAVEADQRVKYAVVAIDADGLESAASDTVAVESVGYSLDVRPEGDAIRVRWDPALGAEFAEARVLREGRLRTREIGRVSGQSSFLDQEVRPGGRYRYSVIGIRADGTQAPVSDSLEVVAPE